MTNYYIKLTKKWIGPSGEIYKDNCGFCVKDLHTDLVKNYFTNKSIIIEEIIVRKRNAKRPIYKGNNYDDYVKALEKYLEGVKA